MAPGYTAYHARYWANALTLNEVSGSVEGLSRSIANAKVDLNPHQVDAALFALRSPLSNGVILADEVGLGKTIEAGIVIAQRWAERRRRILLVVPASLRSQWQQELRTKFYLLSVILDGKAYQDHLKNGTASPFCQENRIVISSYHFASSKRAEIAAMPWDLAVVDEAHRLRNVYKTSSRLAASIKEALAHCPKLLLTATPLQNSLMELYGLVSVIDDHVFGDPGSFRLQFTQAGDEDRRNTQLRQRLAPLCIRTLRRQVMEYIPFTRRVLLMHDFFSSDAEQNLYDLISAYLQRDTLVALPASQRALITLVLRKLLASSTFAISGTLNRLVARLEQKSQDLGLLDDEDIEGLDELEDELAEQADQTTQDATVPDDTPVDPRLLKQELAELRRYAEMARQIQVNAKGEALPDALKEAFVQATALGAKRKAVLFTESRRTQQYLFDLLTSKGYAGKLVLMNGINNDPMSRQIYQDWLERHRGQDMVTGSRAVDIKAAIVEHFNDYAEVLIATEAGAEGINLQSSSLVVNYDLPWNPQRVEQRIGRCHRYGQKHDVVVVNFINHRNAADRRVHQLLREKFRLFEGVFGASDEVLGALESGVDIERRIAEVYQTCRTPEQIEAAFDALQAELDQQIQARLADTRQTLLEHVDEEVTARLRVYRDRTHESLDRRQRWLWDLTCTELAGDVEAYDGEPRFRYKGTIGPQGTYHLDWKRAEQHSDIFYRQDHPLAQTVIDRVMKRPLGLADLTFTYAAYGPRVSALESLIGQSGWLELHRLAVESFDSEGFLILAGRTDTGLVLDQDLCEKLLLIPADTRPSDGPVVDLADLVEQRITGHLEEVNQRNCRFFDEEVLKLDRWCEDLKKGLELEIKDLDRQLRQMRSEAKLAASLADKLEAQKQIKTLEQTRNKKRKELYEQQDRIDGQRDELIARVEKQLRQRHSCERVFQVRWRLT